MKNNQKNMIHVDVIEIGLTTKQMSDFELSTIVGGTAPCWIDVCGGHVCGADEPCGVDDVCIGNGEACNGKLGIKGDW
jgi:bacteriocin-like protein